MINLKKKNAKVLLLIISLIMLTGCTKTLTDENKKAVKFEDTGKTLTENVLCRPTEEKVIELYKENGVDTDKLPVCENFKPFNNYEGLWTTIFVKPLAWLLIKVGALLTSINLSKGLANGLAIILSGLAIRLILAPFTKKTAMQSEKLKEDQKRKAEEMMMIYQKNKINPFSSCLLSFIQIPLLFAYLEAINRTPVIFENKFLSLDMGTTMSHGLFSSNWYAYLIFLLLILGTSYLSFRKTLNSYARTNERYHLLYVSYDSHSSIQFTSSIRIILDNFINVYCSSK